jgi:tetraacyldisaccharide 4'-kinase
LKPLSPIYRVFASAHRLVMRVRRDRSFVPAIPMVVVGALRSGGSGKTSVTSALARHFRRTGLEVAVLVYRLGPGGRDREMLEVGAADDWRPSSEEAVMLARETGARVFATRNRAAAWRRLQDPLFAKGRPFDIILSDDGFQDPRLDGALRILLAAPGERPGIFDVLPGGPFRETWKARRRADLILEGPHSSLAPGFEDATPGPGPQAGEARDRIVRFYRKTILPPGVAAKRSWIAACSLGNNPGFLSDLRSAGIEPVAILEGRNHEPLSLRRIARLLARFPEAGVLCTCKDYAKLEPSAAAHFGILAVGREILFDPSLPGILENYRKGFRKGFLVH